jgi:hypothetical protein
MGEPAAPRFAHFENVGETFPDQISWASTPLPRLKPVILRSAVTKNLLSHPDV